MTDLVPDSDQTYLPGTNWTYPDVLFAFLGGLVASTIGAIAASSIDVTGGGEVTVEDVRIEVVVLAQAVGVLAVLWLLKVRRRLASWKAAFGLTIRLRDWWAALVGLGLQLVAALLLAVLGELFRVDTPEQSVVEYLRGLDSVVPIALAFAGVVILAPLTEEIMFRGMLLSRMLRSLPRHGAIWLSGLVFAAIHLVDPGAWFAVIGLFPVGVVLGYLALSTGDLSRALWAHAGFNFVTFLLLVFGDELAEADGALGAIVALVG